MGGGGRGGGGAVAFFGAALGSAAAPAGSGLPAWARAFCSSTTASSGGFCTGHTKQVKTSQQPQATPKDMKMSQVSRALYKSMSPVTAPAGIREP